MAGSLMAHIPNYTVVWCVKHIVQRNGKFYDTQTAGKMTWIVSQILYDGLPEFFADIRKF